MSILIGDKTYTSPKQVKLPGISRCDGKRVHGWLARVYLPGKKPIADLFSDGRYTGWESALEEALKWREATLAKYPPPLPALPFRPGLIRSNKTGFPGLCLTWHRNRSGERSQCYAFTLQQAGARQVFRWLVHDYASKKAAGEEAQDFIQQTRREQLREYRQKHGPEIWRRILQRYGDDLARFGFLERPDLKLLEKLHAAQQT